MYQDTAQLRRQIVISILCLVFIVLFIIPSLVSASSDGWTAKPLTSLPIELHEAPSIAVYERNIHVVWNTWHDEFDSKVYYRRSLDNGKAWDEPVCLTPNSSTAIYPVVAGNTSTIHVVWKDYRNDNPEIYYRRSRDNGEVWDPVQRITYNSLRKNNIYDIGLAVENSNVYLVWKDYRSGSSEIFFKRSRDNGETWDPDQRLTYDYTPSYSPCIAIYANDIYIAWEEWGKRADICFIRSSTQGESWSEKSYLTNVSEGGSERPNLAAWKNNIYLVWQDTRTGKNELYFKKSSDYGASWEDTRRLTHDNTLSINPEMKVYENKVTVVWQSKNNETFDIWYKTSTDGGEIWSETTQLINENINCYDVSIAIESTNLHIVWQKYYEAGWGDIWHISNCSQIPTISSISLSHSLVSSPTPVTIIVDGFDPRYNKTELVCTIQYNPPSSTWIALPSTFTNSHWETTIDIVNGSIAGTYLIRAKLLNPSGIESDWSQYQSLTVSIQGPNSSIPAFTLHFYIYALIVVIFLIKVKTYAKKK